MVPQQGLVMPPTLSQHTKGPIWSWDHGPGRQQGPPGLALPAQSWGLQR